MKALWYTLLAIFCLMAAPYVLARMVEVWQGTYDEPIHSGATPDCPLWETSAF